MKKKLSKVQSDKAFEVAQKLVAQHVSIKDLWNAVTEATDFGHEIGEAIDPKYKKLETEWGTDELTAKLDEEGQKLFGQYDQAWCDRDYYRCLSNFALGFAAASAYSGKGKK